MRESPQDTDSRLSGQGHKEEAVPRGRWQARDLPFHRPRAGVLGRWRHRLWAPLRSCTGSGRPGCARCSRGRRPSAGCCRLQNTSQREPVNIRTASHPRLPQVSAPRCESSRPEPHPRAQRSKSQNEIPPRKDLCPLDWASVSEGTSFDPV